MITLSAKAGSFAQRAPEAVPLQQQLLRQRMQQSATLTPDGSDRAMMLHDPRTPVLFYPAQEFRSRNRQQNLLSTCGARRHNWQPEGSSSTSVPESGVLRKRKP
jgi:hypothetical protein